MFTERERLAPPDLTSDETELIRAAQRMIMESLDHSRAVGITVVSDDGASPTISVPPRALRIIGEALGMMAQRKAIVLVHEKQELSTVEAANFLNVSRPFVIKEIEAGRLKHRMVGTHRRILYADLNQYAKAMRADQQAALEEMATNARELGLDY